MYEPRRNKKIPARKIAMAGKEDLRKRANV